MKVEKRDVEIALRQVNFFYRDLGITGKQYRRFLQCGKCNVSKKSADIIRVRATYANSPYLDTLIKAAVVRRLFGT